MALARLIVIEGPDRGREFDITVRGGGVGRGEDNAAQLTDPSVSRLHCSLEPRDGGLAAGEPDGLGGVAGVAEVGRTFLGCGSRLSERTMSRRRFGTTMPRSVRRRRMSVRMACFRNPSEAQGGRWRYSSRAASSMSGELSIR